jgi:hypothetical protein
MCTEVALCVTSFRGRFVQEMLSEQEDRLHDVAGKAELAKCTT